MAVRQFLTGLTYTIQFQFRNELGELTSVANPIANIYTPQKTLYANGVGLSSTSIVGKYEYNLFAPVGLTIGHWNAIGIGLTQNTTLFSPVYAFEIIDIQLEPFWLGYEEFRDFLELEDTDRDSEDKLKQALAAAIEFVEGYTNRHYGIRQYDEIIEVVDTDRISLKKFPVNAIVAITPTVKTIPRDINNLTVETITGSNVGFFYRLDAENGVLKLLDSAGFDLVYDNVLVGIAYLAGFATVPEPVRQAALHIAAAINALSCTEGIEAMRFADISFSVDKNILSEHVKQLLAPYKNNFQV